MKKLFIVIVILLFSVVTVYASLRLDLGLMGHRFSTCSITVDGESITIDTAPIKILH